MRSWCRPPTGLCPVPSPPPVSCYGSRIVSGAAAGLHTRMAETAYRTCPLCEATCGLELTIESGAITSVRGDDADPLSKGFICPKGASFGYLDADPDRLRAPRVRRDGKLLPATWAGAFAAVHAGLTPIIREQGREAVAAYLGNPNVRTGAGRPSAAALR